MVNTKSLKNQTAQAENKAFHGSRAYSVFGSLWLKYRGTAIRLFITCWLIFVLHLATNTVREIYPALSLGDHLSFDVSEYKGLHPDIFEVKGRGAFINNNPGASIMGAIPYVIARPAIDFIVTRVEQVRARTPQAEPPEYKSPYPMAREFYKKAWEKGLDVKFGLAAGVMQAFLMAPLSALSAVLMFFVLLSLRFSERQSLTLALLYALATPVFFRTGQLNQNLLACHFAFLAFVLLWRPWDSPSLLRRPRYFVAGLVCGWTVVLDYSGLVVVVCLALYALLKRAALPEKAKARLDLVHFGLGILVCLGLLMAYQWRCFGSPFYPAQHYMPQTEFSIYGYSGIDWPRLDLLWDTTLGIRFGLFVSAPLLLLALYIPGWFGRRRAIGKNETRLIAAFTLIFLLFCAANQYGRLQFNSGVRYAVPLIPFLFLIIAGIWRRFPPLAAGIIAIMATYWSWSLAMYRDVEQGLGVLESVIHVTFEGFRLPWVVTLERLGYFPAGISAVPILVLLFAVLGVLWQIRLSSRIDFEKPGPEHIRDEVKD
jgi:hypothetical protein